MDFSFSEDQVSLRELAGKILEEGASAARLAELDSREPRFDRELWAEIARAELLGVALPPRVGGSGLGFVELCIVLEQVGRTVAPVPAFATLLAADSVARLGSDEQRDRYLPAVVAGELVLTTAWHGYAEEREGALTGRFDVVPAAQIAGRVLVPAGGRLHVVDPRADGVSIEPQPVVDQEPHARVALSGCRAEGALAGIEGVEERALVGLCAIQLGVSDRALRMTAEHVSTREQFGRPIGTFQAVQQRLADAYIDVEAMRWTTWQAAWRVAEGLPAEREARIAKFWACEGGARIAATAHQHHGGVGVDMDYPLHRYYLWTKLVELSLGATPEQLDRLGAMLA